MSSALTVIVLGHAFFGDLSVPNTFPVQPDFAAAPSTTKILDIIPSLTEPTTYTLEPEARRPDYTYTPGVGAHKLIAQPAEWNMARRTCEKDGAHLVIINSVAEAEAVVRLLNSANLSSSHVGVHDLYQEGEFVTIHGEALARIGFNDWVLGQPNNRDRYGHMENCVQILSNAKLNDIPCTHYRTNFVCELP